MRGRPRQRAGLALALLSGTTFGTSGSFASSLIHAGWTPGAAVTTRVVAAALLLTVPALLQLRKHQVSARAARMLLLYGLVAVAGAQLCYFNAVAHLSVAVALLLEYSGILLVVAWGWLRQGHRPRRMTIIGGVAALAGLVLVLDLAGAHRIDVVGVLWGVGAAVGLAVYFLIAAATDDAAPPLVAAWGGLAAGAVVLGVAAGAGVLQVRATPADVTLLGHRVLWVIPILGLALVAGAVAYLSGIAAARLLGAKLASFVGLTEVLSAVVFAWLLLGQQLDAVQLGGAALVLTGIVLVRLDDDGPERTSAAEPSARPRQHPAAAVPAGRR